MAKFRIVFSRSFWLMLCALLMQLSIRSQSSMEVLFNWSSESTFLSVEDEVFAELPTLEGSFFDGQQFWLVHQVERPSAVQFSFQVIDFESQPITTLDQKTIQKFGFHVSDDVQLETTNNFRRAEAIASLRIFPYVMVGGQVRRLTKVVLNKLSAQVIQAKSGHFAENSVLRNGSGDWFKVQVTGNGVHRIDYNFLSSIGVDVNNLNPNHIHIYGNGFGRLPELNSVWRPDDLLKNAIVVVDGNDGSFDPGDYILFYGRGPHKWQIGGSFGFNRDLNIYANYSAYFININPGEPPLHLQTKSEVTQAATHVISDFDAFSIHETETRNLLKGGQRWYGEEFDTQLTQSFPFSFPNINTSADFTVRAFMAYRLGGPGASFNISAGGVNIGGQSMPAISDENSVGRVGFTSAPGAFNPSSSNFSLTVNFNRIVPADAAYLDFILVNGRRNLIFNSGQLEFRDRSIISQITVAEYRITGLPLNGEVWDVTEWWEPTRVVGSFGGGVFSFRDQAEELRTYVALDHTSYRTPTFEKRVQHQNLHGLGYADYLIVTNALFLNQAQRLAALHEQNGLSVHVVELDQLYNEFSGGTQDPTAIKFFAKMFYDRAEGDPDLMPKYMLLFGDGTYDPLNRVPNNNYMCPVYHTLSSEGYVSTLLSDDYFGFLDDNEAFSPSDELDIAVGRLVATTPQHARDLVNKIEHYMRNGSSLYASSGVQCGEDGFASTQGDWRLRYTTIADDEENGYFINNDLEPAYEFVKANHPEMNVNKIYSDAYQQISTAGGERYPEVNEEIDRSTEAGTLVTCYVGHGGAMGAASERIITIGQIQNYRNINRLTLFVSATCEFGRIDDNERVSAGEWYALNPIGGAIALMTTTRAVYFSTNSITTASFFQQVFQRDANEMPRTFGEIILDTKNNIPSGVGNNKRAFMLLGDPALRIALPFQKVVLDSVNGIHLNLAEDTLRALSKARFSGHLEDQFGNALTGFTGIMQPSIFDKPRMETTLGNDFPQSPIIEFEQQKNILYRGRVSVTNGQFNFDFIVPKDIDYSFGNGKSSFYAFTPQDETAGGYSTSFIIGGIDTTGLDDNIGPEITLYLNDDTFVNGGLTDQNPILLAELFDESGINTVGNGIGHDITVILDDETSNAIVLNEFYESDLDTYQSGSLRYQFNDIEPGLHTLTFKAWDVNNNSSESKIEFIVQEREDVALKHVLNYPNPFTTHTEFMFEHNQVCASLETQIEVFTVTGRLVRTINTEVKTQGFRTEGIAWDGRDDFGDQLAKGVYVYRVTVRNPNGEQAQAMEKLYLLK
jgi:hypothetical protein